MSEDLARSDGYSRSGDDSLIEFGWLDHAANLASVSNDNSFKIQKLVIATLILSNILATGYVEKMRLVLNNFH